jgi:TRAP-type transport system periplasmic protein
VLIRLLIGCVALLVAAVAQGQQFTMKLSSPTVNDVAHEWMKTFKAGVEARSGGRVRVEIYPASQLGQIPRTVEGVALGTIELSIPAVGFLIGLEPRFQVFDAPGVFDDMRHAARVFGDPEIRKRLSSFGAAKGIEPLITFVNGPMVVVSHRAIRTLPDFKGQKLRVPGPAPLQVEPFKKLGASPLSIPLGEVLPAMQNHTIDGVEAALSIFTAFKYYDITKFMTYLPATYLVAAGIVNRGFMKSLGPELEGIVRDEASKAEALFATRGPDDAERDRKLWEQNGGQSLTFSQQEAKRYLEDVTSVLPPILASSPQLKEDYEALVAAAKKHRQ